jgi:FtsH-binding integral membrane protein
VNPYANPYSVPASRAPVEERVSFLRRVGLLTLGGLMIATVSGALSMMALIAIPALANTWVMFIIVMGSMFGAQAIGSSLVSSEDRATQLGGFVLGTALEGVAFGYLFLAATLMSMSLYENPFVFLGQGFALVGLTVLGMVAYLLTGPKNLSMIGGALATLSLPMLALMVLSFVFPIGGVFGILISAGFVALSAGGLLYNLNSVMHQVSTRHGVQAAYFVTLGILTLFWNVVVLLMKLQRR